MCKFIQHLLVFLGSFVLLTACVGSGSSNEAKTVIITPAIRGNSASLNVGDTLEIRIPTIPKDGFEWQVQDLDTRILGQEGGAVYTADPSPNSAGGIVTLRFIAIGSGSTTLNLLYINSPTAGTPVLSSNSFSMTVEVK
jgi:predicted secreted protein